MKVGLDTNILVYAAGLDDLRRRESSAELLLRLTEQDCVVSALVFSELHYVLARKTRDKSYASRTVAGFMRIYDVAPIDTTALQLGLELVDRHGFQIFDAVIFAGAVQAGCRILLSEDGHAGFERFGCTIINPFLVPMHPLLATVLAEAGPSNATT
ncbi:PIN domain-containing protein [Prosthecomicrobium sp. N25]|uniref:PIN domain-containing protein n=1 Tax=Prosthecomicrobium sp. N25 TaxID=3129254 RepID=UPI003077BA5D